MKRIEAIITPTRVGKVCLALEKVGYPSPLISHVERHDGSDVIKYLLRGKTYRADLAAKTRVEMTVEDGELDSIVAVIRDTAFADGPEDGRIFVHQMEDAIRIETGERKERAR